MRVLSAWWRRAPAGRRPSTSPSGRGSRSGSSGLAEALRLVAVGLELADDLELALQRAEPVEHPVHAVVEGRDARARPARMPSLSPGLQLAWRGTCRRARRPLKLFVATTDDLPFQVGMSLSIRTTLTPALTAFCSAGTTAGLVGVIAMPLTPLARPCPGWRRSRRRRRSRSCPARRRPGARRLLRRTSSPRPGA